MKIKNVIYQFGRLLFWFGDFFHRIGFGIMTHSSRAVTVPIGTFASAIVIGGGMMTGGFIDTLKLKLQGEDFRKMSAMEAGMYEEYSLRLENDVKPMIEKYAAFITTVPEFPLWMATFSERYNEPEYQMLGTIAAESAFDPEVVSSTGAIGLVQFMMYWHSPKLVTAATDCGIRDQEVDPFGPCVNLSMGFQIRKEYSKLAAHSPVLTSAFYLTGPNAEVHNWGWKNRSATSWEKVEKMTKSQQKYVKLVAAYTIGFKLYMMYGSDGLQVADKTTLHSWLVGAAKPTPIPPIEEPDEPVVVELGKRFIHWFSDQS